MKKQLLTLFIALLTLTTFGQSIMNGGFESWTSATFDSPIGYLNSNPDAFYRTNSAFNCIKTTDAYHGSFAIQLTTNVGTTGDTNMAYIVNSPNPNGGNPCQWQGGFPYNQVPTGLQGYYKSNSMPGDSGGVLVAFKNNGTCLGMYLYKLGGVHSTYTPFNFTFNPPIAGTPDTMVFAAVSSDIFNGIQMNGSMLQLDSVSLTGATQPLAMNGDFENWQSTTLDKPNNWYIQGGGPNSTSGVAQTVDAQAGTYAIEMQTYLGEKCPNGSNCHPAAQGGEISNGYYINNCGGSNCQQGGLPFSNQIDTLCFYYKYAPAVVGGLAEVNLAFKNAGNTFYNYGYYLSASGTYQYMEVPINTMATVDTAIVSFESSRWEDSLLMHIGSVLKVDGVHFKSQPIGIKKYSASNASIQVYPNPSNDGYFSLTNVQTFDLVRVYNLVGQEVNASIIKTLDKTQVYINTPGAYFIQVNARGKISTSKVIVNPK